MDIDNVLDQYSQGRRDFHGINLSETDLSGLNLSGIDLRDADFSESDLIATNLSQANLSGCNFSQVDLSNANLIGADLSNANLFLTKLHDSKINETTKINSKWALVWEIVNKGAEQRNLNSIDLSGANLSDANLRCADLFGADLCSSNLNNANLSGANLSNANLECADLSDAELSDANLSGASLINTDLTGTNLKNIDLSSIHIEIHVDNTFMSNNDIFRLERQFYERFEVYKKVEGDGIPLEGLAWRELEKLVAELLSHENYEVSLGKGSKDDGVDVIAVRKIENIGFFKAIWQVKHSQKGRKVGIEVIRQLADTRNELKASKGIIVTNSFLTREALSRIDRDKFTLGKIDRDDLVRWIEKSQPKYKSFLGMLLN